MPPEELAEEYSYTEAPQSRCCLSHAQGRIRQHGHAKVGGGVYSVTDQLTDCQFLANYECSFRIYQLGKLAVSITPYITKCQDLDLDLNASE